MKRAVALAMLVSYRRIPLDVGMKAAEHEGCVLHVSEFLFRLTTECVRLYSNETHRHQSLGALISRRLALPHSVDKVHTDDVQAHLNSLPSRGKIRLDLEIPDSDAQALSSVRHSLNQRLSARLTMADALSAVLFDYILDAKAAKILDRLNRENLLPAGPEVLGGAGPLRH